MEITKIYSHIYFATYFFMKSISFYNIIAVWYVFTKFFFTKKYLSFFHTVDYHQHTEDNSVEISEIYPLLMFEKFREINLFNSKSLYSKHWWYENSCLSCESKIISFSHCEEGTGKEFSGSTQCSKSKQSNSENKFSNLGKLRISWYWSRKNFVKLIYFPSIIRKQMYHFFSRFFFYRTRHFCSA